MSPRPPFHAYCSVQCLPTDWSQGTPRWVAAPRSAPRRGSLARPQSPSLTPPPAPRLLSSPRQQDGPAAPELCHPGPCQRHFLRGLVPGSVQVSGLRVPPELHPTCWPPPSVPRGPVLVDTLAGSGGPSLPLEGGKGPEHKAQGLPCPRARPRVSWAGPCGTGHHKPVSGAWWGVSTWDSIRTFLGPDLGQSP